MDEEQISKLQEFLMKRIVEKGLTPLEEAPREHIYAYGHSWGPEPVSVLMWYGRGPHDAWCTSMEIEEAKRFSANLIKAIQKAEGKNDK